MASLDVLFPLPNLPQTALHPQRWPGATDASAHELIRTLKDNHTRWHIFFNDKGFHNHTAHHLLAAYALGADAALIDAAYASDAKEQRTAFPSPGPIDGHNFAEHLGDEQYYSAYLAFFAVLLAREGISKTLEDYIFSPGVNVAPQGAAQPAMLARLLEGLLHPLIHTGNGCEFELLGIVAEGLAQTCVHKVKSTSLYPSWTVGSPTPIGSGFLAWLNPLSGGTVPSLPQAHTLSSTAAGPHALTILARLLRDPRESAAYQPADDNDSELLDPVLGNAERTEHIRQLADEWGRGVDLSRPGALEEKIGELAWANALMYGVGGWSASRKPEFKADFFLMHLVTSSLFLPSLCAHLQPTSQKRLLVAYLAACLAAYVARGRPALDLRGFFSRPFGPVAAPGPRPTPHKSALHPRFRMPVEGSDGGSSGDGAAWADGDDQEAPEELHPNAWLALAQSALFHPEAHVTKCVRALAHDAGLYGSLPRRGFAHLGVGALGLDGLDGAEWIDGSLFARAAEATMGRVGWTREGEEARFWDRL